MVLKFAEFSTPAIYSHISTPEFSTPAIYSHIFHSRIFSRPHSISKISVQCPGCYLCGGPEPR